MSADGLSVQELEALWDLVADGINRAGAERESVFLTKLALLLANELGDFQRVSNFVNIAGQEL
jgi:hypothetical protein